MLSRIKSQLHKKGEIYLAPKDPISLKSIINSLSSQGKAFNSSSANSGCGVYLKIKVNPGVNRTMVRSILGDETLKIDIAAQPVKGRANKELIRFLAKEFEILEKDVKIISGHTSKTKLLKITK